MLRQTSSHRIAVLVAAVAALAVAAEVRADDLRSIRSKARSYRAAVDGIAAIERIQIRSDEDLARVLEISDRHIPHLAQDVRHWIVDVVLEDPKSRVAVEERAKGNPRLWGEMVQDFSVLAAFDGVEGAAGPLKAALAQDAAVFKRVAKHLEQGLDRLEREHPIDLEKAKENASRRSAAGDLLAALGDGLLRTWQGLDLPGGTVEATSGPITVFKSASDFIRCSAVAHDSYQRCNEACKQGYTCSTSMWGEGRLRALCTSTRDRCYARCTNIFNSQRGGCYLM
jgi:hypothetical protein